MNRTAPKTVKIYPLELNRILHIANQASATGEAKIGDLRWFERWLMPRIKRRAARRWGNEGWTDYPPKRNPQPEPPLDEPAVTVFVTLEATATPDDIMAAIARRAQELLGTPEGMAKALAPEPSEKEIKP